jgi:hypothetical protein
VAVVAALLYRPSRCGFGREQVAGGSGKCSKGSEPRSQRVSQVTTSALASRIERCWEVPPHHRDAGGLSTLCGVAAGAKALEPMFRQALTCLPEEDLINLNRFVREVTSSQSLRLSPSAPSISCSLWSPSPNLLRPSGCTPVRTASRLSLSRVAGP